MVTNFNLCNWWLHEKKKLQSGWSIIGSMTQISYKLVAKSDVSLLCERNMFFLVGLNSLYTLVLYNFYFLPSRFYFLLNLVPMVYENMEMVHSSNFSSKTNV
jgi:hypothetical protein